MSTRGYYPSVRYEAPPLSWLAGRNRLQRITLSLAFVVSLLAGTALLMGWVSNEWPDAAPFALVGAMILGLPAGAVAFWYCVGLIFEGKVRPW